MKIIRFNVGDILVMKKKHPCSSYEFRVMRIGTDVRIVCVGCGRDITLGRETLEKSIKQVKPAE